ncbi:MAG: bifunctional 5,10-methylene-tetrahydrofolate dehydrogenase/5,10-methylene-tetrahydrofolate [Actinomycetia bacterium]|nr:bifunctional 5,10-methylene-tetrahydrofolate dehydrogenase/5,10-methylene-tetrahydrofolate [Actinomycetes bacterium]
MEDVIYMPGAPVAEAVLDDVTLRVAHLRERGISVGLGTILVGDDGASASYVAKKHVTSEQVGISSHHIDVAAGDQAGLMDAVRRFNEDPAVTGFLIQNPTPGCDFNAAMEAMDPAKDADGLHPHSLGLLAMGAKGPRPATPSGIQAMLQHYEVPVEGRHVVIVGRGPTLGRPLSLLMALKEPGANAAVTTVHTGVQNLADYTRQGDIVIGAAGVPGIIQPDMVRPGAAVVSGGIVFLGKKLLADVDESVADVAGWITPRLGGVGPTTVALLLRNTVEAAERRAG